MSNIQEFDNINDEKKPDKRSQSDSNGLQNLIRIISFLPCFPKSEPVPQTPHIDQVCLKKSFLKGNK